MAMASSLSSSLSAPLTSSISSRTRSKPRRPTTACAIKQTCDQRGAPPSRHRDQPTPNLSGNVCMFRDRGRDVTAAASASMVSQSAGLLELAQEGAALVYPGLGWALVGASWAALIAYHYKLYNQHKHGYERRGTLSGPNIEARRRWAQFYARNKKDVITAVQSIRNVLMIAITNTSTSVALISVCLGPLLEAYAKGTFPVLKELLYFPFPVVLDVIKFSVLLSLLVAQFICFAQCCNYWVHITLMLPVVEPEDAQLVTAEGLADIAIHAQLFWWLGYRCLYLTIPAVVWVVTGTIPFAVASLVMLMVLTYLDRPLKKTDPLEYNL